MEINDKVYTGLYSKEVEDRKAIGQVNIVEDTFTKSYKQIFLSNTLTFFNVINVILLAFVIFVGSYKNSLFIFIITINTATGIYQEVKAKRTLDKLSILTTSKVEVVRNSDLITIPIDEIVIDDLIVLVTGHQVPTDAKLVEGQLEVNESLLTGEADAVEKLQGDTLFSGSYVTSGKALCKVIHVGNDNYMQQITKEAKAYKRHNSDLNRSLNKILKIISLIILPLCILLFLKQFYIGDFSFSESILSTVAAALGMIPEGLILLTSVALTISVMRLAKNKTLVQELFCIETLARVDVLCLDKTGTITQGTMQVERIEKLKKLDVDDVIGNLMRCLEDSNVTSEALKNYFPTKDTFTPHFVIPFSSERKYSGVSFEGIGTYYLGAFQFLFPKGDEELEEKCFEYASQGFRILLLGHTPTIVDDSALPSKLSACAIILISDVLRKDAKETFSYFAKQGVQCMVISGDDPITVSSIAKRAGLPGANNYVDATSLHAHEDIKAAVEKYRVFGRVTPSQKKEMVICLKELNHTVAMTGDGVNDVLAFKEADCSIAMASGSDAAKHAANLVLLDNNFNAMPHIVNEGRRVINNISMSASMFLIKTIFSIIITIGTIILGQSYPFEPIQLSIISGCGVGIPTFFLTYESNFEKVEGSFLKRVLKNSFPTAFTIAIVNIVIMNLGLFLKIDKATLSTICVLFTGWNYMLALKRIYSPMNTYRKIVIYLSQALYFVAMIVGQPILELTSMSFTSIMILIGAINFSPLFTEYSLKLFEYSYSLYIKHRVKFKKFHL